MKKHSLIISSIALSTFCIQLYATDTRIGTTIDPSNNRLSPVDYSYLTSLSFAGANYDLLKSDKDLSSFISKTNEILEYLKTQSLPFPAGYPEYLKKETQEKNKISNGSTKKALKEMNKLAKIALEQFKNQNRSTQDELDLKDAVAHIFEINSSLDQLLRKPIEDMSIIGLGKTIKDGVSAEHYGRNGTTPATNLKTYEEKDLSKVDPYNSTFWQKPGSIANTEMYYGFNRKELVSTKDQVCKYFKAKRSFGSHPGFAIMCGDKEIKVKFSDFHSEPFNSRMLWALGYETDPTDYTPGFKLSYDRKILTEINSRKKIIPKVKLPSVVPDIKLDMITKQVNAFKFIKGAILKDGTHITKEELQKLILRKMNDWDYVHLTDQDFLPEGEAKVDVLEFVHGQFQAQDEDVTSIGPWEAAYLKHDDRREVRGMGMLAGWFNLTSMRFDDARLLFVKTKTGIRMLHRYNELGTGLGKAVTLLNSSASNPNDLQWTFTSKIKNIEGKPSVELIDYHPVTHMSQFDKMTLDDARWMGRQIAQLSEDQIKATLIAAGFHSEYVKLYLEKMISRRDKMVKDLELDNEFSQIRSKHKEIFNYNPKTDGLMSVTLPDGTTVSAPAGEGTIVDGILISPELKEEM